MKMKKFGPGGAFPQGVSSQGVDITWPYPPRTYPPWTWDQRYPPCGHTYTYVNVTFPQLHWRVVIIGLDSDFWSWCPLLWQILDLLQTLNLSRSPIHTQGKLFARNWTERGGSLGSANETCYHQRSF